jgi:glycosyltransferase involved in cell wall biosynthesis
MNSRGSGSDGARVSVVVPTIGRPELTRAVESVRRQTVPDVEIVVVCDAPSTEAISPTVVELADIVHPTGGGLGGGRARNVGVELSSGHYVAFLDDDDEWLPEKLAAQLAALESSATPDRVVLATRHVQVDVHTGKTSGSIPTALKSHDQTVGEYLFRRRRPAGGRASMYTSTLLCSRALALEVPWDPALRRHQDWDWLVRLDALPDVRIEQVPGSLVRIQTGSTNSISAGADWASSLAWADHRLRTEPGVYVDFVVAQSLRYALSARSAQGAKAVIARVWSARRIPALGPMLIALGGLVPRRTIERLMVRIR